MAKQEKIERVAELKARIDGSDALLLADYRGLTVSDITELRRSLSEGGTRFAVVKNTLMQRAVEDGALADLKAILEGPSAVAFVSGDPVAAAKKVVDASKRFPSLVLKGGFLDGSVLSADEARSLADLESREVMLSKIAGMVKSEVSRAAGMFVFVQSRFLSLLGAYREQREGEAPPAETETVEAVAAEAEPQAVAEAAETEAPAEGAEAEASPEAAHSETEPAGQTTDEERDEPQEQKE
jgi:large subunit ribosomal protein L10